MCFICYCPMKWYPKGYAIATASYGIAKVKSTIKDECTYQNWGDSPLHQHDKAKYI